MSVSEPSDAVNTGMPTQTQGRLIPHSHKSPPQLDLWLVGWLEEIVAGAIKPRQIATGRCCSESENL